MLLTSEAFVAIAVSVAVLAVIGFAWTWHRTRDGRRRSVAIRVVAILVTEALVLVGVGSVANRQLDLIQTWGDLVGSNPGGVHHTRAVAGRLDARIAASTPDRYGDVTVPWPPHANGAGGPASPISTSPSTRRSGCTDRGVVSPTYRLAAMRSYRFPVIESLGAAPAVAAVPTDVVWLQTCASTRGQPDPAAGVPTAAEQDFRIQYGDSGHALIGSGAQAWAALLAALHQPRRWAAVGLVDPSAAMPRSVQTALAVAALERKRSNYSSGLVIVLSPGGRSAVATRSLVTSLGAGGSVQVVAGRTPSQQLSATARLLQSALPAPYAPPIVAREIRIPRRIDSRLIIPRLYGGANGPPIRPGHGHSRVHQGRELPR